MNIVGHNVKIKLQELIDKLDSRYIMSHIDCSRCYINIGVDLLASFDIQNKKMRLIYKEGCHTKAEVVYDPGMNWLLLIDDIHIPVKHSYNVAQKITIKNIDEYFDNDYLENSKYSNYISTSSLKQFFLLYEIIRYEFLHTKMVT